MTYRTRLYRLELALAQRLQRHVQRRLEADLLNRTYPAFARRHPEWAHALFDHHFLTGRGAEALAARDPRALAWAWTTQFKPPTAARPERDLAQLTAVAIALFAMLDQAQKPTAYSR